MGGIVANGEPLAQRPVGVSLLLNEQGGRRSGSTSKRGNSTNHPLPFSIFLREEPSLVYSRHSARMKASEFLLLAGKPSEKSHSSDCTRLTAMQIGASHREPL